MKKQKKLGFSVGILIGDGASVGRAGSLSSLHQVSITDSDRGVGASSGVSCLLWVSTDGVSYGAGMGNISEGDICSYNFDPDNNKNICEYQIFKVFISPV